MKRLILLAPASSAPLLLSPAITTAGATAGGWQIPGASTEVAVYPDGLIFKMNIPGRFRAAGGRHAQRPSWSGAPLATESAAMDFATADAPDNQVLNQAIWKSIKGSDSHMPAPVYMTCEPAPTPNGRDPDG